jgi:hypothetical protein
MNLIQYKIENARINQIKEDEMKLMSIVLKNN